MHFLFVLCFYIKYEYDIILDMSIFIKILFVNQMINVTVSQIWPFLFCLI